MTKTTFTRRSSLSNGPRVPSQRTALSVAMLMGLSGTAYANPEISTAVLGHANQPADCAQCHTSGTSPSGRNLTTAVKAIQTANGGSVYDANGTLIPSAITDLKALFAATPPPATPTPATPTPATPTPATPTPATPTPATPTPATPTPATPTPATPTPVIPPPPTPTPATPTPATPTPTTPGTPTPATPTPATPTPIPTAAPSPVPTKNLPPELDSLQSSFTVLAGQELSFTVTASDPNQDEIKIVYEKLPKNATFVQGYNEQLHKWAGVFKWKPSVEQAREEDDHEGYTVKFQAVETSTSQHLKSKVRKTSITVVTSGHSEEHSSSSDDDSVKSVSLRRAQYRHGPGVLTVAGKIKSSHKLSKSQAAIWYGEHKVDILDYQHNAIIGTVAPNRKGAFKAHIKADAAPVIVAAEVNNHISLRKPARTID